MLATEKRLTSPLLEPSSIEKVVEIDSHIGCAMSGLTSDARTLINIARVQAQVRRRHARCPTLPCALARCCCCRARITITITIHATRLGQHVLTCRRV